MLDIFLRATYKYQINVPSILGIIPDQGSIRRVDISAINQKTNSSHIFVPTLRFEIKKQQAQYVNEEKRKLTIKQNYSFFKKRTKLKQLIHL